MRRVLFLISCPSFLFGQINQNFDGCDRAALQTACWEFASVAVTTTDRLGSTGCSARSGALSGTANFMNSPISTTPVGSTISISFSYRFTNNSSSPNLNVFIENMDGTIIPILNLNFPNASAQNFSGTVVTTKPYFKIRFVETGSGGSSRIIVDNIVASSSGAGNITFPQTTGSCATAFPVRLTQFEGKRIETGIKLTWKTAWEIENKMFEIYRSKDAVTFEKIGFTAPSPSKSYFYVDQFLTEQQYYYKLHQLDMDGRINTSKIIAVKNDQLDELLVFPNPSENEIKHNLKGIQEYSIFDSNGKKIIFEPHPHENKIVIESLLPGQYTLWVKLQGAYKTFKIQKQ